MAQLNVLKNEILNGAYDERFRRVYVTEEAVKEQHERYVSLANDFAQIGKCADKYGKSVNILKFTSIDSRIKLVWVLLLLSSLSHIIICN